jgi:hypothetical protein
MAKPLFRWTIGHCLQQGLDILVESFDKTLQALGEDKFDWYVCYNGLTVEQVRFLPQRLTPENISDTIKLFESGVPWKDIASESKMSEKETVSFFKKLSPHHPNMQWIQRPRPEL